MIAPGVHGGGARRARARRGLVGQLRRAKAFSLETAAGLEVHGDLEERELQSMVRRGSIRPGMKGGYWLDRERYAECRRQELVFVVGVLLVMGGLMTCLLLNAKPHHRHRQRADTEIVVP